MSSTTDGESDDMQNKTHATRHAHWDCFSGVSCSALLATCMDAMSKSDSKKDVDVEDILQRELASRMDSTIALATQSVKTSSTIATKVNLYLQNDGGNDRCTVHDIHRILHLMDPSILSGNWIKAASQIFSEWASAAMITQGHDESFISYFQKQDVIEVIGTLILLQRLQVDTVDFGPLPLGHGSQWRDDVLIPVPSPTTLQLLLGMSTCPGPEHLCDIELVTPAAAAFARVVTRTTCPSKTMPKRFIPQQVAVGLDLHDDSESNPLTMRLLLGQIRENAGYSFVGLSDATEQLPLHQLPYKMETMTLFETNLDDMTAEALAFSVEMLLREGAADAWVTPIVMKKGRAAHTLHCLCRPSFTHTLLQKVVFRHTSTLGVRIQEGISRAALRRTILSVPTPYTNSMRKGIVDVKVGFLGNDKVVSVKAEFDHCREIAMESGIPLVQIANAATQRAMEKLKMTGTADP